MTDYTNMNAKHLFSSDLITPPLCFSSSFSLSQIRVLEPITCHGLLRPQHTLPRTNTSYQIRHRMRLHRYA
ncbi:hypothetical protein RIF29_09951 [Crotalaria pallida]|uniref:Uncharacterized protein n=1 Tax=Crotalaria pallida TaxID=3830 RepID=A0AAN9FSD5_CROPI